MSKSKVWDKPFEGCFKISKGPNAGKYTDEGFWDLSPRADKIAFDNIKKVLSTKYKKSEEEIAEGRIADLSKQGDPRKNEQYYLKKLFLNNKAVYKDFLMCWDEAVAEDRAYIIDVAWIKLSKLWFADETGNWVQKLP